MAEWLGGQGDVGVSTLQDADHVVERLRGFEDALRQFAPQVKVHVVYSGGVIKFDESGLVDYSEIGCGYIDLLKAHPEIRGLFATYAAPGAGAAQAVEELGLQGKVHVLAFDFDELVIKLVGKGKIRATVGQDPYIMGCVSMILLHAAHHAPQMPTKDDGGWRLSVLADFLQTQPKIQKSTAAKLQAIISQLEAQPETTVSIDTGASILGWEELLGLLSKDFEDMRDSISGKIESLGREVEVRKHAEGELRRLNEELERRVQQRTSELKTANEQLLALSQIKDEFVANVSHEFRTPLASLKVHLHLLTTNPEKLNIYLGRLQRDTNRLERLVEDLLFLSRLDQERIAINLKLVDLAVMAKVYVGDRASLAQERNLTLVCTNESAVPFVKGDPNLLEQALGALLTNALNYTPDGGKIEVKAHSNQADTRYWVGLSVRDTGPGIPPAEIPHVVERFFRGQAAQQSNRPGTGLGLAIVKEIMDRHQGRLEIESEGVPGQGAMFTLWLPAHDDGV
jgi:signal transduction histidine kinase